MFPVPPESELAPCTDKCYPPSALIQLARPLQRFCKIPAPLAPESRMIEPGNCNVSIWVSAFDKGGQDSIVARLMRGPLFRDIAGTARFFRRESTEDTDDAA